MADTNRELQFPGQREGERVVTTVFRHWYVVAMPVAKALLVILLTFLIPLWLNLAGLIFSYALSAAVYYLWIVFWIGYILYEYLNWCRDRFIITDQRIINVDQRGLFRKRVAEVELEQIHNITHEVVGFFPTMLNFGTVTVRMSGDGDLLLEYIANPAIVKEDIARLIKTVGKRQPL